MGLKSIVNSVLASAIIASAAPVHPDEHIPVVMEDIRYYLENMHEPKVELPVRDVKYKGYWVSKEEYDSIIRHVNDGSLAPDEIKQYLGFISLMRYRELLDFIADYYEVDKDMMLKIINQESAFNINAAGSMKERGLGQNRESTSRTLIDRITNHDDELYYPFIKKEDYSFRTISKDYRLNIILIAAKLKAIDPIFKSALTDMSVTEEDLTSRIEDYGRSTRLKYLSRGNSRKFKFYKVGKKTRKRINDFWREHTVDSSDLIYLVYNGGSSAIANMLDDNVVTEVLAYNFTSYCSRKYLVDHFLSLYEKEEEVPADDVLQEK